MKIHITLLILSLFVVNCNSGSSNSGGFIFTPKVGTKPIEQKSYKVDFDELKVSQSIQAEIVKATEEKVVVSAPGDILDDVLVENTGEKLFIHFKPGLNISAHKVKVIIYAKDFSKLEATSSASIAVKDQFTQEDTEVKVSSSASISGNLEANDLEIDVSSSGSFSGKIWAVNLDVDASSSASISLTGKVQNADVDVSSSATIDADKVVAKKADLKASSSGALSLSVSESINAVANSSGSILIKKQGNPVVIAQKENSGGSVEIQ